MSKHKTQVFNDGVVKIYNVKKDGSSGGMPKEKLELKGELRYKERTVGIDRYWKARQANVKVACVLRCPRLRDVSPQDIAIPVDGKQYRIVQVQYPEDIEPPVMDLTLEGVTEVYEII